MKLKVMIPLALLGSVWASSASAIVVGGIDFGVLGESSHLETTTVAETFINGDGQTLSGYGQVNTINGRNAGGVNSYCTVDANCQLYFYFTDYVSQNFVGGAGGSVGFTGGTVSVYYDPNGQTRNLLDFSSPDNVTYIQGLTEWVQLEGHLNASGNTLSANGTLTGATAIAFTGSGLLDVLFNGFGLPSVQTYLDGNSKMDGLGGLADITLSTSGTDDNLPMDTCNYNPGDWCIQGSADLRGDTLLVSEPGSLALLGLGLAGFGLISRRRRRLI